MKSITITAIGVSVLAATLLVGMFALTNIQKVNAQMSGGNMTGGGGMMGMMAGPGPNITGSLKFSTILGNALSSQIKVGLNQSAMTAEKAIGNNSHAVAAHFGMENGYLVYTVWVIDGSYNLHKVIVDAGNGKVLSNQPVSKGESMMMHGIMMGGGDGGMMMQHGPGMMMHSGGPHGMMMGGAGMSKPWR
jgi:hypothetical protein